MDAGDGLAMHADAIKQKAEVMLAPLVILADIAKSLFGLAGQIKTANQEQRSKLAALLEQIASCLSTAVDDLRAGNKASVQCGELKAYAKELDKTVSGIVDEKAANELSYELEYAYKGRLEIRELPDDKKEAYLEKFQEAAGQFRGLANIIRAR